MSDTETGLVACDECGAPHSLRRADPDSESSVSCPKCGNGSFTELDDPSGV